MIEAVHKSGLSPSVSVVIPTYNRQQSILMSVQSVLSQTIPPDEVIVVDDCSDDDTLSVLKELRDSRLRVVRSRVRSGAPAARNLGARLSKGEWIAFQDSDDYWFAHKLQRQFERLRTFPEAVLCYCGLIQFYGGDVTLIPDHSRSKTEGFLYEALLETSFISTQTIVVKRTAFEAVGGFREDMPRLQDWELVLRIAKQGAFCFASEPLVIAYATPGNLTSDARKGALARVKIIDSNYQALALQSKLLSKHYFILATQLFNTDDFSNASAYFRRSIKCNPFTLKAWGKFLMSSANMLKAKLTKFDHK